MNVQRLENELWQAADQLRANSKLAAAECAMPVLGLIPLRHADNRFKAFMPEIEADIPGKVPAKQREELIKLGFQGKAEPMFLLLAAGALYLTLGDLQAGRTLFGFVLVTLGLALHQEGKTERAIEGSVAVSRYASADSMD